MPENWNADERATLGMQFLDHADPGWAEGIDPDRLNMGDGCACVFGQRYGTYTEGHLRHQLTVERAAALGVYQSSINDTYAEYAALTAAWRTAITVRRAAAVRELVPV